MSDLIKIKIISPNIASANMVAALVGPKGPIGDAQGALLVSSRLAELSLDQQAQAEARANIGLATLDGGTFF